MQVIIAFMVLASVVALILFAVLGYFNTGAARYKKDLAKEQQRSNIAQTALREISAGAEMPIFVASNALSDINVTYNTNIKEIK